jgi:hypothetical protein
MREEPIVFEASGQTLNGNSAVAKWYYVGFRDLPTVDGRIRSFPTGEIPRFWRRLALTLPCDINELGNGVWEVTATYSQVAGVEARTGSEVDQQSQPEHGDPTQSEPIDPTISFSNKATTQHITQSRGTWQRVKNGGGVARDFKRAIGVNPTNGEVAGTDIPVSSPTFTIVRKIPVAMVTPVFLFNLDKTIGCVNAAKWLGYERGEVSFDSYELPAAEPGSLTRTGTFNFVVSRNQPASTEIAPGLTFNNPIDGHSHVWVTYKNVVENGRTVTTVDEAYEEQVQKYVDFNKINLHKREKLPA